MLFFNNNNKKIVPLKAARGVRHVAFLSFLINRQISTVSAICWFCFVLYFKRFPKSEYFVLETTRLSSARDTLNVYKLYSEKAFLVGGR